MTGMTWDQMTPEERLIAEQAVLNFRELNKARDTATDGTVLDVCETMAIEQGRELVRRTVETSLSLQAEADEKKWGPTRTCQCGLKRRHRGRRGRKLTTAAGDVRLSRICFECPRCLNGGHRLDGRRAHSAAHGGVCGRPAARL